MSAKPLLPRRRSCDERYGASEAAAAGLIAGAIGQVIGFPLDTLKVRTQLGHTKAAAPLMRGVAGPVITSGAVQSVNFAVYDFVRRSHGDAATDCEAPLGSSDPTTADRYGCPFTVSGFTDKTQQSARRAPHGAAHHTAPRAAPTPRAHRAGSGRSGTRIATLTPLSCRARVCAPVHLQSFSRSTARARASSSR